MYIDEHDIAKHDIAIFSNIINDSQHLTIYIISY